MRSLVPMLIAAALLTPACNKLETKAEKQAEAKSEQARDKQVRQACASQASYERLKSLAFEKAEEVRAGNASTLDRLAAATVVRMEEPVVKSRDDALNVTVCKGRMVIDLPPGAEDAFNGERRLVAEVEFAAQEAADGSGLVYQLDGAEPIIYRLAAIDMKTVAEPKVTPPAPEPAVVQTAERSPVPAPPAPAPAPAPRPRLPEPPRAKVEPPRAKAAPERPRPALARPSFNCRYARTRTEQMVCADEALAARDREMASQYYSAIAVADSETRRVLRGTRDRFLAVRERCSTPGCVAAAYEDRMDEIDHIMTGE
jgi:uncharacterized protein YecT (DUF1311 family)